MSRKIPQSEWGAIVARREQGESLNAIARSYNCSAATIHSILNRVREGGAQNAPAAEPDAGANTAPPAAASELPDFLTRPTGRPAAAPANPVPAAPPAAPASAAPPPMPAAPPQSRLVLNGHAAPRPAGEGPRAPEQRAGEQRPGEPRPIERPLPRRADAQPRSDASSPRAEPHSGQPAAAPRPATLPAHALAARPEALSATLDAGLRAHAETVVEAFRAAFDRALAENSAEARDALRRAAAELMRAGARTTIVLERLEAATHRPPLPRRDRANGAAPQRPAG